MQQDFATQFTGWSFLVAGVLTWAGWMLLPSHIGTFFVREDFARVRAHFRPWIWLYRGHIFGLVITAIALVALGSLMVELPARVMVWPGVAVAAAGMFVSALATAFYYHHGAWGAREMEGKSNDEIDEFIDNLRVDTEYVTCLVRFGRVFTGLGLLLVGIAFLVWGVLPVWVGGGAVLLGLSAMALTMGLPDQLSLFMPIFHLQALWLAATGAVLLWSGVTLPH